MPAKEVLAVSGTRVRTEIQFSMGPLRILKRDISPPNIARKPLTGSRYCSLVGAIDSVNGGANIIFSFLRHYTVLLAIAEDWRQEFFVLA